MQGAELGQRQAHRCHRSGQTRIWSTRGSNSHWRGGLLPQSSLLLPQCLSSLFSSGFGSFILRTHATRRFSSMDRL